MANRDICFPAIVQELSKSLDEKQAREVANKILDDLDSVSKGIADPAQLSRRMQKYVKDQRILKTQERIKQLENIIKKRKRDDFYSQFSDDDQAEGIKALLGGTDRLVKGGNNSAYRIGRAKVGMLLGSLDMELEEKGLVKLFKSGQIEKEIMIESFELGRPNGQPGKTNIPEALEIAKILDGLDKKIIEDSKLSGIHVERLPGRIMKQSHDPKKLRDRGYEGWRNEILPRLDRERTFGLQANDDDYVEEFLQVAYGNILEGKGAGADGIDISDDLISVKKSGGGATAKSLEASRKLHFKSGEDFYEYNLEFGTQSLAESVLRGIDFHGRNSGLIEVFGRNPSAAIEGDIQRIKTRLRKEGNIEALEKFTYQVESGLEPVEAIKNNVNGSTASKGRGFFASLDRIGGFIVNTAKLGKAVLTAGPTDFGTSIVTLRSATGNNIAKTTSDLVGSYVKVFPKAERKKWAKRGALVLDDLIGSHVEKLGGFGSDDPPGFAANLQRMFFKYSGFAWQTSWGRTAAARTAAMEFGEKIGKSFDQLEPRARGSLTRFDISTKEWDMLRVNALKEDGEIYIIPEVVDKIDGLSAKEKRDLKIKLGGFLSDWAEKSSPQPGPRVLAMLNRGEKAEGWGAIYRMINRFSSFPLTMHSVARTIAMSDPSKPLTRMRDVLRGEGDISGLVQLGAATTLMGAVAIALKDTADGKTPRDMNDPKFWLEAFVRGGAGGRYADIIAGEYYKNYRSLPETLGGPVLGTAADFAEPLSEALYASVGSEDASFERAGKKLGKFTLNNTPGNNVWWLRPGLNYMFVDEFQEFLSEGYADRVQEQMDKRGQRYLFEDTTGF